MFKGSLVALITPFRDGAVDETAFQEHVAWQIGQGTHGLVPIGTTGECPALEEDEQERLIKLCVEVAKGPARDRRIRLDPRDRPASRALEKDRRAVRCRLSGPSTPIRSRGSPPARSAPPDVQARRRLSGSSRVVGRGQS